MTTFLIDVTLACAMGLSLWQSPASTSGTKVTVSPSDQSPSARPKTTADDEPGHSDSGSAIPAAQPVITVHGLCQDNGRVASGKEDACETVVTRGEFERLMNAVNLGG